MSNISGIVNRRSALDTFFNSQSCKLSDWKIKIKRLTSEGIEQSKTHNVYRVTCWNLAQAKHQIPFCNVGNLSWSVAVEFKIFISLISSVFGCLFAFFFFFFFNNYWKANLSHGFVHNLTTWWKIYASLIKFTSVFGTVRTHFLLSN